MLTVSVGASFVAVVITNFLGVRWWWKLSAARLGAKPAYGLPGVTA
jgi:hypothetical protein